MPAPDNCPRPALACLAPQAGRFILESGTCAQYDAEEFRNDAFGNVLYSRTRSSAWGEGIPQLSTYGLDGQLFGRHGVLPSPLPQGAVQEELDQGFDGAGGVRVSSLLRSDPNLPQWRDQTASRPYYDGNGRLAVVQRYAWHASGSSGTSDGAWEEYRYDALGRRVMTRVRRPSGGAPTGTNPLCSSTVSGVCSSYYERTWWAGDQILAEWRTADGTPNPTNSGTVGYVHAPGVKGIDAPVAVITSTGTRVITEDWRGMGESSLFPNGAPADNTLYGGTAITVAWPSGKGAYFTPYLGQPSGSSVESTWLGSLVENGAGAAGLLYRRNRYYDPQSGRFTQQDPIGIAGGVNVYGFAAGDPVNYADPFGLCPIPPQACIVPAVAAGAAALGRVAASPTGQRVIQRGSELARNLMQSGAVRQAGAAAHHIVAKGARAADPARQALARVGVQVDEAVNGVFLPATRDAVSSAANHLTLHTQRYYQAVNRTLENVETRQEAVEALKMIKDRLLDGSFPR